MRFPIKNSALLSKKWILIPVWGQLLLVLWFGFPGFGQTNKLGIESKLQKAHSLRHSKPDSAILLFQHCISESKKSKFWELYALSQLNLATKYAEMGHFESALPLADSASRYFDKMKDFNRMATISNLQANVLMQTGNHEAALPKYLKCISLSEKTKNKGMLLAAYSNVSTLYLNLAQYEQALKYAMKQFQVAFSINNRDEMAYACAPIADVFSQLHQQDSVEKYVGLMEKAAIGTQNPDILIMLANEQGSMLNGQNRYKEAIPHFLKAAELAKEMQDKLTEIRSNINAGMANSRVGQMTQGISLLNKAIQEAKTAGEPNLEKEATKYLAEAYAKVPDFKNAYKHQLNYQALSDQLLNKQSQANIQALEAKYQVEKKEAAIQLLNKENRLNALKIAESKNQRNLILLAGLALLGFVLFGVNRMMLRRKLAAEKNILENRFRLSADLHDDVGATLSSISIYTEAIKNKLRQNEPEKVMELVNKIGENARETISNLGDIVWNLNPINDSAEKLFIRMESTATLILSAQNTRLHFQVEPSLLDFEFSLEAKQNLYLIFKETINNAAKYAQASEVFISFQKVDKALEMNISDNGKGFNVAHHAEGNGLRNIIQRAEALGGKAEISSSGSGTKIGVSLPLSGLGKAI